MLPASERLLRDSVFQRAYAGRRSISSPILTLYVLPRQSYSKPRLPLVGFVVGKKVHNKAVHRNRLKRQVREAYRKMRLADISVTQWYAMVWVVHKKALDVGWEEICSVVMELTIKAAKKYGQNALLDNKCQQPETPRELLDNMPG